MKKFKINVIMMGGLGNQLFQYATAANISKFYGAEIVLDYRFLKFFGVSHPISLTEFTFREPILVKNENQRYTWLKKTCVKVIGLIRRMPYLSKFLKMRLGIILSSQIDEKIFLSDANQPKLIFGYFQTRHYIESVRDSLEIPVIPRVTSYLFNDHYETILKNGIVAIHVRLGDYKNETDTIGNLSEQYYLSALENFDSKFPKSNYLIFTNDADELALNFQKLLSRDRVELFRSRASLSDFEIFSLMSACSGHILANSTFSYWSAALATNSKMVIRPTKWFKNLVEPQELFPEHWLGVESDWH